MKKIQIDYLILYFSNSFMFKLFKQPILKTVKVDFSEKIIRLPKTRALKIILFKHYTTDAPI